MIIFYLINQQSLTFLALGTRFMKNIPSPRPPDLDRGMILG